MSTSLRIAFGFALLACTLARADDPSTQPAEALTDSAEQATTEPSAVKVTPAARTVLRKLSVYSGASAFQFDGRLSFDIDAAGQTDHRETTFTSIFSKPNFFRHEMKADMLMVSNGQQVFADLIDRNQYMTFDAPKSTTDELAAPVREMLLNQNPALLLILTAPNGDTPAADAKYGEALLADAKSVDRIAEVQIDQRLCEAIKIVKDDSDITVVISPETFFITRFEIDFRRELEHKGVPNVKTARATIDYTNWVVHPKTLPAETFAWSVPKGHALVKPDAPDEVAGGGGGAGEADAAQQLVGKPAPDFKLTDLDGKTISLAEFKGSVVILDFWATWCGPCRESLPHLDEFAGENKAVRVFAVNLNETREKVLGFLADNKLPNLHPLLDSDGSIAQKYAANAIPETVVIDRAGKVRKVIVGFDDTASDTLKKAVEAAGK